jgi:GNAT superfamily N-acetyltransferase
MTAVSNDRLEIREAIEADLPSLLTLYSHLHPDDPPLSVSAAKPRFDRLLRYDGSVVLVGLSGSQIVTSCTLIVVPNLTRAGRAYALIENVVTGASFRKNGYATAILHEAAERAWKHDCYKVMLLTGSTDPATLRFYEKAGFEQSKTGFQMRKIAARP